MTKTSRRITMTFVVLIVASALGLGAAFASGALDVQPGGKRIQLTGQTVAATADAEAGHSRGDVLVFVDNLFDADGASVGEGVAEAVVTSETLTFDPLAGDMLCTITITLGDGQISLVGAGDIATILSGEAYSMPVVGGSGAYSKARGEAVYQLTDPAEMRYDLTLILR